MDVAKGCLPVLVNLCRFLLPVPRKVGPACSGWLVHMSCFICLPHRLLFLLIGILLYIHHSVKKNTSSISIWTFFKFVFHVKGPNVKIILFFTPGGAKLSFKKGKQFESVSEKYTPWILRIEMQGGRVGDGSNPPIVWSGHWPSKPFVTGSRPICTQAY